MDTIELKQTNDNLRELKIRIRDEIGNIIVDEFNDYKDIHADNIIDIFLNWLLEYTKNIELKISDLKTIR